MTELEELRKKIEEITIEMLSLLQTRTEIAKEIGKIILGYSLRCHRS